MSKSSSNIIQERRKAGQVVIGETLASALGVIGPDSATSWDKAAPLVTSPPLRSDDCTPIHLMELLAV